MARLVLQSEIVKEGGRSIKVFHLAVMRDGCIGEHSYVDRRASRAPDAPENPPLAEGKRVSCFRGPFVQFTLNQYTRYVLLSVSYTSQSLTAWARDSSLFLFLGTNSWAT